MLVTQEGYYTLKQTPTTLLLTETTNYYEQEVFKRPPKKYGDLLLVSNHGRILLLKSRKFATTAQRGVDSYYSFTHTFPTGVRTQVRLHRIMLETFKPYNRGDVEMFGSFVDGDVNNVTLSNLEWVEQYAYKGLTQKRKVIPTHSINIQNKETGETFTTRTIKDAAELINKSYKRLTKHFRYKLKIEIDEYTLVRNTE